MKKISQITVIRRKIYYNLIILHEFEDILINFWRKKHSKKWILHEFLMAKFLNRKFLNSMHLKILKNYFCFEKFLKFFTHFSGH